MYTFNNDVIVPWVEHRICDEILSKNIRAIGQLNSNNKLVAGAVFGGYNEAHLILSLACDVPMNRKFLAMMFDYPFKKAGVNRLTAFIKSNNQKSIHLAQRLGFVLESTLQQATLDADLQIYRMFKNECRFITDKYLKALGG
jgi:hypothetical protein